MFTRFTSAELLFAEAEKRGLEPRWETADGLFSFAHKDKNVFVYYSKLHLNSQLGSQICGDKSLTRAFLAREGFPNIPYCYSKKKAEVNGFFDAHHPIIQKPLLGMKSEDVRLITERSQIQFDHLENSIFEQYIEGTEVRCLILHNTVAVQKKILEPTTAHPWRKHITNLNAENWSKELTSIAEAIASTLHMTCMAVDFIVDAQGKAWILELNSMPGLHSFHNPDKGEPLHVAALPFDTILRGSGR
jgi:D-alanine-D-alanine ligase-like ATP-grasp enzyme